ncbi:MAG: hypothetical protein WA172_23460 [Terriglobales bacterium]
MDDLSITNPLGSPAPAGEVHSRPSTGGDQQQSGRRRAAHTPEPLEEEDTLLKDDDPHAVDEQA